MTWRAELRRRPCQQRFERTLSREQDSTNPESNSRTRALRPGPVSRISAPCNSRSELALHDVLLQLAKQRLGLVERQTNQVLRQTGRRSVDPANSTVWTSPQLARASSLIDQSIALPPLPAQTVAPKRPAAQGFSTPARPSRRMMEPISPSVWRSARRNTARRVKPVRIARGEYQRLPPRTAVGMRFEWYGASRVRNGVGLLRHPAQNTNRPHPGNTLASCAIC